MMTLLLSLLLSLSFSSLKFVLEEPATRVIKVLYSQKIIDWVVVSNIFCFTPGVFVENSHFDKYFSDGLKPPTIRVSLLETNMSPPMAPLS